MGSALMVVDVQVSMFFGPWPVSDAQALLKRIGDRVLEARLASEPVIFVQNDGPEDEMDAPGEPWWELVLAPKDNELVVRKTSQDVFESNPNLANELRARGITSVELVGVQSDMCLKSSALGAKQHGFQVVVKRELHSTYDGGFPGSDDPTPAAVISDRVQAELQEVLS